MALSSTSTHETTRASFSCIVMAIATKINTNHKKESEEIENYEAPVNYDHKCPVCGSRDLVRNGTYERNVVYLKDGRFTECKILMQRLLCKACRKTRSFYPPFLARGREYSLGTMFEVSISKLGRKTLSKKTGIPESQIRSLRKEYREIRKRIYSIVTDGCEIHLQELTRTYEECFFRRPFEAHQRDMTVAIRPG